MNIRNFTPNDQEVFIEMCKDFYQGGAALEEINQEQMQRTFDYIVSDGTYVKGFLFEYNNEIAGYGLVILYYSNEVGGLCGLLDEIYISPSFRGKGLASEYLDGIASILGDDLKALRLEVCHSNKHAMRLYENAGFKELKYKQLVREISD